MISAKPVIAQCQNGLIAHELTDNLYYDGGTVGTAGSSESVGSSTGQCIDALRQERGAGAVGTERARHVRLKRDAGRRVADC